MKLGTDNRKTTIAALVLLLLAAGLLYRGLRPPGADPNSSPARSAGAPSAATLPEPAPRNDAHRYVAFSLKPTLDPQLRLDLLAGSESTKYEGGERDIFVEQPVDIPVPVAPGLLTDKPVEKAFPAPPPPPPPPPIKLKFWGWASSPGERKAIFLADGDNGFMAHEGDIIEHRYKVLEIGPTWVEIEDLLNNNQQNIRVSF